MIELPKVPLPTRAATQLQRWTAENRALPTFDDQVHSAKAKFKQRNKKNNATFDSVKSALRLLSNDTHRCVYCEDNYADEVEHIRPKDIYPEQCFAWDNYVYACGPCNGPKNNHFAVLDPHGQEHDVTPPTPAPTPRVPPVAGAALLIDPRAEDPMALLALDLSTGGFAPHPSGTSSDQRRATWTRDTLGLNERQLPRACLDQFDFFRLRLAEYAEMRDLQVPAATLDTQRQKILQMNHQTVLREMWRQRAHDPNLSALFQRLPEVATWW